MDSKNIFIAASHLKTKIEWEKTSGNEWSYVGDRNNFMKKEVQNFIDEFFGETELYMVVDRHNSYSVPKHQVSTEVSQYMSKQNVTVCNKKFSSMVEFSYIGVVKHGKVPA